VEPHPSFHEAFIPELKNLLIECLEATTEDAVENYAATTYSTANSFGNDCWNFRERALLEASVKDGAPFTASKNSKGALRCRAGEWEFGVYCVGRTANADIRDSFPNPQNSAGEVAGGPFLPAAGMAPAHNGDARGAIVAYMASPDEGLGAVYLCIPRVDEDENIVEWLYSELIWRDDDEPITGPNGVCDAPPAEAEERPQVRRRARGERRAG
jgi:hypothetical protein